jgi:hypothetical protein
VQQKPKGNNMKKGAIDNWEMRKKYDFSNARPNKYAKKYAESTNIVVIEPDLVEFFPDSESVNATLRVLVSIFPQTRSKSKAKKSSAALVR